MMRGIGVGSIGLLLCACGEHSPNEPTGRSAEATHTANVNVSNQVGTQSEVAIAVNPANPLNVVAVANDLVNLTNLGVWFSLDGGASWTANFIDDAEDGLAAGDSRFDPNVAFDSDGNVYVVYSTFGSANTVVVARSTDGGQNFGLATIVTTDSPTASNLHTAMVTTRADPSGDDDVLVVFARVIGGVEAIEAALSLDAGVSYPTNNGQINDALQRTFVPWAEADENGNFAVVWEVNQGGGVGAIFHDTLDATTLASGTDHTVSPIQITDFAAATSRIPAQPERGIFSVATVDVDRTTGRVIVGYTNRVNTATNDTNIFVRFSDDDGVNWSAPIQVNDDGTTTSQFMPRFAIDQSDQNVYAIWYDARNDTTNNQRVNIFSSFSIDGGANWSVNHQLTDAESDESTANPARNFNNYLEYIGLSAENGVAHVAWTDARDANFTANLNEEVFTTSFAASQAPVAVCADFQVAAGATCQASIDADDIDAGSFDPDGPPPTCTLDDTGPFGLGAFGVTLTCVDDQGGSSQCTATVTVVDETPPVLACPASVNVPCSNANGAVATFSATAVDNCGSATPVCAPPSGSTFPLGTTLDTCNVSDASGNAASCSFQVTVALGDNPVCCPAGTTVILGTSSNNTLNGTNGSDCILGRGAQDVINGNGGNDFISGGDGDDTINAGAGNDVCFGGTGQDRLSGGTGDDVMSGGSGDDQCFGGDNADTLLGGPGQDRLFGDNGDDRLVGETGDDRLDGGAGNDVLDGSGLHDVCLGGAGTDVFLVCETQTQ
jgi:Ca2+-binding RTX toxin-like protein